MTETDADLARVPPVEVREEKALERLLLFSDAVIAIVITLMVLEVKPPQVASEQQLLPALKALWHEYLAVFVSFLVIGIFWSRHHERLQWVRRVDLGLVWINLLFLLSICALPFVTAILAKHPGRVGTIVYALAVAAAALLMALLSAYAGRPGLTAPDFPARERRIGIVAALATAAAFLASIPIALWGPHVAKLCWLAVLLIALARRLALSSRGAAA